MTRLTKGTPEWQEELAKLPVLLKAWSDTSDSQELTTAVKESLEKLGFIVSATEP